LSDIFSILAFVLLFATTGFAYSFSASKNWSVPIKVISAIIGFSLAATLLCFLYIGTGFPGWMRWPVEFFFMPVKAEPDAW
jgi:hypothetical protein